MKLTLDEHLSPHFTVGEFFRSGTAIRLGIDNNPDAHPGEGISTAEVVETCVHCAPKCSSRCGEGWGA